MSVELKQALAKRNKLKKEFYTMMLKKRSRKAVKQKFKEFEASHKKLLEVCKKQDTQELMKEIKNAA